MNTVTTYRSAVTEFLKFLEKRMYSVRLYIHAYTLVMLNIANNNYFKSSANDLEGL